MCTWLKNPIVRRQSPWNNSLIALISEDLYWTLIVHPCSAGRNTRAETAGNPNQAGAMIAPLIKCIWAQGRVMAGINVKCLGRDQWSSAADELWSIRAGRYSLWFWFRHSECWLSHQTFWQRLNRTIMKVIVCFHISGKCTRMRDTAPDCIASVFWCWHEWGWLLMLATYLKSLSLGPLFSQGIRKYVPVNIFSHPFVAQS